MIALNRALAQAIPQELRSSMLVRQVRGAAMQRRSRRLLEREKLNFDKPLP